jgi:hypothetical protein
MADQYVVRQPEKQHALDEFNQGNTAGKHFEPSVVNTR